ncbi:MAG: sensor histidine kinase [Chitinophagaceae bacterium]
MKLLTKYNRTNIIATIIILLISGVCYYVILRYVLISQLDDDLKIEEQEIIAFAKLHNSLPKASKYKDQQISFSLTNEKIKRKFISTNIFDSYENEYEESRQLVFPINVNDKNYIASVSKSEEGTEDLLQLIVIITLGVVILLLLILFIINRFLLNKLWKPFYTALHQLQKFNLSNKKNLQLDKTNIDEFTELNNAIIVMTDRITQDYEALKTFTENASHEIQTPLAIIKSKLEVLIQSENLKQEEMQTIQSVYEAANRLSKLNQSLLLLTKIENQQFSENNEVNFGELLHNFLNNYEELIKAKKISVTENIEYENKILMNETLAEILVSNLITNAIKHNVDNGSIEINFVNNELIISNTGAVLQTNPNILFERFQKDKTSSDSLGLGLAIVKKICERYGFAINYFYVNSLHKITLQF